MQKLLEYSFIRTRQTVSSHSRSPTITKDIRTNRRGGPNSKASAASDPFPCHQRWHSISRLNTRLLLKVLAIGYLCVVLWCLSHTVVMPRTFLLCPTWLSSSQFWPSPISLQLRFVWLGFISCLCTGRFWILYRLFQFGDVAIEASLASWCWSIGSI
jgi:hypothetical protein